jgi:hypothetical protein
VASELNEKYDTDIKLFGAEAWKKVARVATACAGATFSCSSDYKRIVVTKDHVDWASRFLSNNYNNNGYCGNPNLTIGANTYTTRQVPTEQKIGKVKSLLDIPGIDDYAFSLDFSPVDLYMVEDERLNMVYEAITVLLDHDQIKDDWYDDADGTLKNRISRFMEIMRVQKIEDKDNDGIPDHIDDQIG